MLFSNLFVMIVIRQLYFVLICLLLLLLFYYYFYSSFLFRVIMADVVLGNFSNQNDVLEEPICGEVRLVYYCLFLFFLL